MRRLAYFCGGFGVATLLVTALPNISWWPLELILALVVALCALFRPSNRVVHRIVILLAGLSLGLGYTSYYAVSYQQSVDSLAGDTHAITALVTQWPEQSDYGYGVTATIQLEEGVNLSAWLYVDEAGADIQPGDTIQTIARLYDASLDDDGNYYSYFPSRGIYLTGSCYGTVEITRPENIPWTLLPIYWTRTLQQGISTAFSEETAPLVTALVTGDRSGLSDAFYEAIQRTGLAHTVVVSGMHMAFLVGMMGVVFGKNRRSTALAVILAAVVFAIMVGATPSVTRAAIMIILVQLAPLFGRETDSITSLLFALFLILLANPLAIAHVGLQLSFASLAGIFCVTETMHQWMLDRIPEKFGRKGKLPQRCIGSLLVGVSAILSVSLGASLFTIPIIAYYFGTVTLIYCLSNLLVLWCVAWCFSGGLLAGGVAVFAPALGGILATGVEPFLQYFIWMTTQLSQIPFASLPVTSEIAVGWLVFTYALLAFWLWRRGEIHPLLPMTAMALGLVIAIGATVYIHRLGAISVTVLDVGQGQSVYLRMGDTTALVDCGGDYGETVGDTAADYITSGGYFTLDYLILTHCHTDHACGVIQLMERMDIGLLVLPVSEGEDEGLRSEILAQAELFNIPVLLVAGEHTLETEVGEITLYPPLGDGDENEIGLTVLATYNQFDTLITGDMGEDTEKLLVAAYDLPIIELYLVGHHGSKYSTSQILLDEIAPAMAAISVGASNTFGHPTQEVLERLEAMGTEIYRTDTQGDIIFRVGD